MSQDPSQPFRFPIEAGHILMFARAVGYPDVPDRAPTPTFLSGASHYNPTYDNRPPTGGGPWRGSGRNPTSLPRTAVPVNAAGGSRLHAEQHYEYHAPFGPGDVLTPSSEPGATWEKESRRAGRLRFAERITRWHNQHGTLVITTRDVRVYTERKVASEGGDGSAKPTST